MTNDRVTGQARVSIYMYTYTCTCTRTCMRVHKLINGWYMCTTGRNGKEEKRKQLTSNLVHKLGERGSLVHKCTCTCTCTCTCS